MCSRTVSLAKSVNNEEFVVFTGGVSQNVAIKKFLEEELKTKIVVPPEPEITCALGAALTARNMALSEA